VGFSIGPLGIPAVRLWPPGALGLQPERMNMTDLIELKGRLNGRQRNRLNRLLDMMYKPSEIAEEVGFNVRQVYRVYIKLGCPNQRDRRNHIWINGKSFVNWYQETFPKLKVKQDQVFCLTCKKAVDLVEPIKNKKDGLNYLLSFCPLCGRKLVKIISNKKLKK